jgi:RNA polymerase sigma factor for flagellar operon FliA
MTAVLTPVSQTNTLRDVTAAPSGGNSAPLLWDRYRTTRDEGAREELLRQHISLVHFVARRMSAKTTAVEYDELVSAGALGLLAALEGYDPSRGFAFTTYAVTRIQGAILDDLRKRDWMPRSSRKRSRQLAAARAKLQARLLRAPTPAEVAAELGLELGLYWRWCDELDAATIDHATSSEHAAEARQHTEGLGPDLGGVEDQPERMLLIKEERARVHAAIQELPARDQQVLALCFFEELTLREVAVVLRVTESRVSQLRKRALERLAPLLQN